MSSQVASEPISGNSSTPILVGATNVENAPSGSTHHTPDAVPNDSSQHVGNPRTPLPVLVQQAVEKALDTRLKEMFDATASQFNKSLRALTEEVNRLKKTSQSLNVSHKQAPSRSLDSVLRKVFFTLSREDTSRMSALGPRQILERLRSLGDPFNQIKSARIVAHANELRLFTSSLPVYEQLVKRDNIATITRALGLAANSSIKLEIFWVILHEYNFADEYLRKCKEHLESMRRETGLDISEVKYVQQRLLWGFRDCGEAIKACQEPLFFSGDHALAMAYDQRATPMFCRRCGRPGHMQDHPTCPNKDLPREESWPCIICAQIHLGGGGGAFQQCPNRDSKDLYRCLNCAESGLEAKHRTDYQNCPAPNTMEWRAKWKALATTLPDWAVSVKFPTTDELRAKVEKGISFKGPKTSSKNKSNASFDSPVQAEGSGTGPGIQILNRKGLMRPKETQKPSAAEQAIESGDDMEVEATHAAPIGASDPTSSQSTAVDHPVRQAGQGGQQMDILGWARPVGGRTRSRPDAAPSSSADVDAATPKRKRGRPKGSTGKKRVRSESEKSLQLRLHSGPRVGSFSYEATSSLAEPANPPVQPVQHSEGTTGDPVEVSECSDSDFETVSENEDGRE